MDTLYILITTGFFALSALFLMRSAQKKGGES
jgi:hypothetical protein